MSASPLATVAQLAEQLLAELAAVGGSLADDRQLLSVLKACDGIERGVQRVSVGVVADLERRGTFAKKGYKSFTKALTDLLGWEWSDARRRLTVAQQVCPRIGLDATVLPARLPATAAVYTGGECSLRQVEVIARVLGSAAARRLDPDSWASAEEQLAAIAGDFAPADLHAVATALVESLDQDGPEPDDRPPAHTNELFLTRNPDGSGGKLRGRFDDPALYDAIATVIDAKSTPLTADDERSTGERQADALADVCGYVLDHGDVPECGGERPHLNVIVRLEDLENRARAACLDFGGTLPAETLRMLCCDAKVIPIVLDGNGQPLDVGRATRVIPDGLRRAIAARDRGCARCGRPPSWCEIHHLAPWECQGDTCLENCAMLCRSCHRLAHRRSPPLRIPAARGGRRCASARRDRLHCRAGREGHADLRQRPDHCSRHVASGRRGRRAIASGPMAMRDYLVTEVALDHAEGHLSRRDAMRRLGLLGLSAVAASALLAACAGQAPPPARPASAPTDPGYDVAAATARGTPVTFPGTAGQISGVHAAPDDPPRGAVLVIHENRGLTDHFRALPGRLAGDGHAALAPDLLSRVGGTAAAPDATAALGGIAAPDLVADLQSAVAELGRRHPGVPRAAMGFCFGGGMVWRLLDAGTPELAAAVPFYGPLPENPTFAGSRAAVLGVFAEKDVRVNAGRDAAEAALTAAGLTHELVTVPGVDHAFFNDTGPRFDPAAAATAYQRVLAWYDQYLR